MHSYTDEGVVIKRFNYGEANKLLTLFTRNHGKVTIKAIGLRRSTSKRVGLLELFNHIKFHAVFGRGEIDTLTEVQLIESHPYWRKHLGRVTLAYQMAEVIDKLTPDHQPHPEIFEVLKSSFLEIGNLKIDWKLKIENWKLQILQELGYWSRDKGFPGDIDKYIEELINRPLHSPKLLSKLK
ncbi:DNA repair protein RecO [Candidatus Amesbacteria bacterium RIFCSPHIGHO2_02_FULL_47_9]|uniref:DNA repair protein RecO n=1 Tax=Candidatus Amesbacteria bacterium RIFCSPHIGHO2_01_FULL_48_32b TaxID=1797253 RepID=A0A1F4YDB5_9BACT|nr:MAG: DNA repair protein RecO [Candidatus Amesbacteria bacterium RIFCSPHIGHO2_01_FULL_48_32b]OGD02319.1 MAG: DNA repair protein RecO [Candidatus Amesbacteria bacterium RIFCSPHIGHO2_02_FULL_47_9]OGD08500.1 MAG: DNA repair protein RecO [Candidatus Amesbacteria bacterium RIFCSPLOWO2_01_FULL_49_25]